MTAKKSNANAADVVRKATNALRPVDGLVPSDHMIELPPFPGTKEEDTRLYLEVQWRLQWYLLYCMQNGIEAAVLELDPTFHLPSTYVTAACEVMMNGKMVGRGIGGVDTARYANPQYAAQMAATIAKGRALANCGFGTLASSSMNESGGREEPCDSGISAALNFQRNPDNPMMAAANEPTAPTPTAPTSKPKAVKPMTPSEAKPAAAGQEAEANTQMQQTATTPEQPKELTLEEAMQIISPLGNTLGELLKERRTALEFYALNAAYAHSRLQKACQMILDNNKPKEG